MDNQVFEDIEIAPASVVKRAARDFAAALAESPQFTAFKPDLKPSDLREVVLLRVIRSGDEARYPRQADPRAMRPNTPMPNFDLSDSEIGAIISDLKLHP